MSKALHDGRETQLYKYDSAGRLITYVRGDNAFEDRCTPTGESAPGAEKSRRWWLDGAGNWKLTEQRDTYGNDSFDMRAVTSFNEYVHAAGADLNYDDNGNLMNDENHLHYHWDGFNRLRRVTDAAESTVATYVYDTDGRRLAKDLPGTTSDTLFAYDGWQVIVEYDSAGTPLRKYAYGAFINEPLFLDVAMEIALARRIEFQCVLPMPRQSGGKPPHSKAVFSAKPASHKRKRKGYSGLYSNEMKIK